MMIRTLIRVLWLGLVRDRIALGLTFVLPIVFFSIFAAIFGNMGSPGSGNGPGSGAANEMTVVAVDLDGSEISRGFLKSLDAQDGVALRLTKPAGQGDETVAYTRDEAIDLVFGSSGDMPAAVIVPAGFGERFGDFAGEQPTVEVIYDPTNPIASYAVGGLVQAASFQTAPDVLIERGMGQLDLLEDFDAGLTGEQRDAIAFLSPYLRGEKPWSELEGEEGTSQGIQPDAPAGFAGMVKVDSKSARQVVREERAAASGEDVESDADSMMPYYAAGIGVMFLLFSMVGAAGSMLKEVELGVLDRVLSSNITMTGLLASKWAFFALVGSVQIFIMFVWGWLLFGIDLWTVNHITGFWIMTLVTAAAASAFGMMMATLCRTRGQLDGISTIVILMMSAVGGSMIPKVFMPGFMRAMSDFTFNGQALNGFLAVFWHDQPGESVAAMLGRIAAPAGILAVMGAAFFAISRLLAKRWSSG